MFIKFSDQSKKIIVKDSRGPSEESEEQDVIYLDEKTDDRRAKILNEYKQKENGEEAEKKAI